MTGSTMHLSIITVNVNGLNTLIKRHRIVKWVKKKKKKTRPNHVLLTRNSSH
jgi:exonuclease III